MRARRLIGDQPAAVERSAGADAVRHRRERPEHQRAAHAVALRADLLRRVDRLLRVEERDERGRVFLGRARRADAAHQRPQFCHVAPGSGS